jgi:proteasome lid subunit RPN8/RPN11
MERAAARADERRPARRLPRALMLELFAHARESHPEECCGLLVGPRDPQRWRAVRCSNVQSARQAQGESDLDARHGFWIDERELLQALRAAEQAGEGLQAIYHSHVDTAAYLSHADLRGAVTADGQPLWPGVAQLVVSVWDDGVREAAWFDWEAGRFAGRRVQEL